MEDISLGVLPVQPYGLSIAASLESTSNTPQKRSAEKVHNVIIDSSGLSGILHAIQILHCPYIPGDCCICSWRRRWGFSLLISSASVRGMECSSPFSVRGAQMEESDDQTLAVFDSKDWHSTETVTRGCEHQIRRRMARADFWA